MNATDGGNPTPRTDVFAALSSEREYQLRRWGYRQPDGTLAETPHSPADYILYMKAYLDDTIQLASKKAGYNDAMEQLRKVVTLGVACFEQHGVTFRDLSKGVINARDGRST